MYKNERCNEIMEILTRTRYASVEYLAKKLHISASSIRRDLADLEKSGAVIRSYGGVEAAVSDHMNIPFSLRMRENAAEKKKIAQKAARLVNDGDVILADGSTTVLYLIRELTQKRGITVVTNGVAALNYLSSFRVKTLCTGGTLNEENRWVLVGDSAVQMLSELRANLAFFSSQALDDRGDLFDNYQAELPCIRQMLASASRKVFLCDSSKVGKISTFRLGNLSEVDTVVCDEPLTDRFGDAFPRVEFL